MKILIIEDDAFFQKFYLTKLRENGFEVESATDGEEGLKKVAEFKPDVILLDLILPKKDGFEVLETLAERLEYKKIPVLVFSTLGEKTDIEKVKSLGASDFFNKSFSDVDNLLSKIKSLSK